MRDERLKDLTRRLRSVEGHVSGVRRMIEEDRYCIDVIRQIEAVEEALRKIRTTLLAGHLETCVTTAVRGSSAKERQRVLRELLEIYRSRRRVS